MEEVLKLLLTQFDQSDVKRFALALSKFYDGDKYVPSKEQIWATIKHILKTREKDQLEMIANACSAEFVDKLSAQITELEQKQQINKENSSQPNSNNNTTIEQLTKQIEDLRKQHETDKQTILNMLHEQKKSQEIQLILQEMKRERTQMLEEIRVERKTLLEELKKERNISQNLMQTVTHLVNELKEQKQHKQKVNETLNQIISALNK